MPAALPFNPDLKVGRAIYNEKEYIGIESLDNARRNGLPEVQEYLNSAVIYAYGTSSTFSERNYPVLFQTQGMNKKKGVKSLDGLVRGFLLGKPKLTSAIAKTIHTADMQIGKFNQPFDLIFRDRFFMKNQVLLIGGLAADSIQLHVYGQPVKEGKGWRYTVRILGGDRTATVPFKYVQAGSIWSGGVVAVSLEHSRGTESRAYFPYQTKNYLNTIRQSIKVAGNAANKVLNWTFNIDGETFQFYYDWEKYLTERMWNMQRDTDLVISQMTMDEDNHIENVDSDSGKPIYRGMGMWWQIPESNSMSYSVMTENLLENYITDLISITDQLDRDPDQEVVIDIMAGFGFLMEMDKALKRNMTLLQPMPDANLMIEKNAEGGLTAGRYFTRYRHRSGVVFRFTSYPGFDKGQLAASAERHPVYTNLPITSFYAMVMDFSFVSVDAGKTEGNITYLYEEGREYIEGTVRGMAKINGKQGGDIATDVDASSLEMMVSQGIHINYPMSMGKIVCKIS